MDARLAQEISENMPPENNQQDELEAIDEDLRRAIEESKRIK